MALLKSFVKESYVPLSVNGIKYGLLSAADVKRLAHLQIVNRELYELPSRNPTPNGCLDRKLGVSNKATTCETCGRQLEACSGHFGYIKLNLPVFHIGYFKNTLQTLQMICKSCARVLLNEEEQNMFLSRLKHPHIEILQRRIIFKLVIEKCRKVTICPHCGETNGLTKKVGSMKIVHEKFKRRHRHAEPEEFLEQFGDSISAVPEIGLHVNKAMENINPKQALDFFSKIPISEYDLLDMNPETGDPTRLIITHLVVPPVCLRPSVGMDDIGRGSNEDDLTMKLAEIVHINNILGSALEKCSNSQVVMEDWDFLQLQCAMYLNSDLPGVPSSFIPGKPIRGLCQRLKGKKGRFRGNLSGKRVDFSSRTVISPDPNLEIDEVAVPVSICRTLTFPEIVTDNNIDFLREAVMNGPDPEKFDDIGANFVEFKGIGKRYLKYGDRTSIADDLGPGDVVERHMMNGDVILFNRQPSLHKMSIMSHKVRIMPGKTFRINLCVCAPYNADFDGDEMNLHFPQSQEARSDAKELMCVTDNIMSTRTGSPLVAPTQDFLTAVFILTQRDVFFSRSRFCQICTSIGGILGRIQLPSPCILKPLELWSGKQVFTYIFSSDGASVNLETSSRVFSGSDANERDRYLSKNDGFVVIQNGELLSGVLCKKTMGSGSKNGLYAVLIRDFDAVTAGRHMGHVSKVTSRYLADKGLSFGLGDVETSPDLIRMNEDLIEKHYQNCEGFINDYERDALTPLPGCNKEESLEAKITGELSKIRDTIGNACLKELPATNSPLIMMQSGSKGNAINLSQMMACIGQQTINGQRIGNGFIHRTLPHFPLHSKTPQAKGFVANSFYKGINPTEFFFHACGGREGLVDTAVKTAETGYMQRRLMKAMEDVAKHYDGTVRISNGQIVQFTYGDDGLDPVRIEQENTPFNIQRILSTAQNKRSERDCEKRGNSRRLRMEYCLSPMEIRFLVGGMCKELDSGWSRASVEKVLGFFNKYTEKLAQLRTSVGLTPYGTKKEDGIFSNINLDDFDFSTPFLVVEEDKELTDYVNGIQGCTFSDLAYVFNEIKRRYTSAFVTPGEAVGALAAQSIGEPATQMSIPGNVEIIYSDDGVTHISRIDEFVEDFMKENGFFTSNGSSLANVTPNGRNGRCIRVPSLSSAGKLRWSDLSQVSKHAPNGALLKVATESGRTITATKSHSFVIRTDEGVKPVKGSSLHVGDRIPAIRNLKITELAKKKSPLVKEIAFLIGVVISAQEGGIAETGTPLEVHLNIYTRKYWEGIKNIDQSGLLGSSIEYTYEEVSDDIVAISLANSLQKLVKEMTEAHGALLACEEDVIVGYLIGLLLNQPKAALSSQMQRKRMIFKLRNTQEMHHTCLLFSRLGILPKQDCIASSIEVTVEDVDMLEGAKESTLAEEVAWDRIVSMEEVECPTEYVYDFSVDVDETFTTSSGLITHNTLKTFHFAGVSSMNVTLGVPRIKEIINATTAISTPIITAELLHNRDINAAKIVKGRIEKTTLGEICKSISEVFTRDDCYISVVLDLELIDSLQLYITMNNIVESILANPKLKIKKECITEVSDAELLIAPSESTRKKMAFNIQYLRVNLHKTIIVGFESVARAVINEKRDGSFNLLAEGDDFGRILGTNGVDFAKTVCNNLKKVQEVLGIEAARRLIINEIVFTMESYGIFVDRRHVLLLADVMTFMGEVLGITRFGIAKMKDSVLTLASFETTTDHLFDAAVHCRENDIVGVSENIILGKPMALGSGMIKLLMDARDSESIQKTKRTPILENPSLLFNYKR